MIVIALTSLHVESIDVHAIPHDHPVPHQHMISTWSSCPPSRSQEHTSSSLSSTSSPSWFSSQVFLKHVRQLSRRQFILRSTTHCVITFNVICWVYTFSLHALKYHQSILPHLFLKGDNAQGSSDGRVESLKEICSGSVIDSILWTTWYWYYDHIIMPKYIWSIFRPYLFHLNDLWTFLIPC